MDARTQAAQQAGAERHAGKETLRDVQTNNVGLYIHTHWSYRHPYAARTWTLDDWRGFLSGLKRLGYNWIQIWPLIDVMPLPLTDSDRRHLQRLAEVITMAHRDFDMRVIVGVCANPIGNARATAFAFEDRPYFDVTQEINPADPDQVATLFQQRREALAPLAAADGLWVIDSDPGGYPDSPPEEFVALLRRYRALLDELRPGIELIYWVWAGWPGKKGLNPPAWRAVLSELKSWNPEPWSIHIGLPEHLPVVRELGLTERAYGFPYNAIEDEPALPWTRFKPQALYDAATSFPWSKGLLGNAQTHCLQLPHIYCLAHYARGGTSADLDLAGFAEELVPGLGPKVEAAWRAMGPTDVEAIDAAAAGLAGAVAKPAGPLAGLLFGDANRFLEDLRHQLAARRALWRLEMAAGPEAVKAALKALAAPLRPWVARHGFVDYTWRDPVFDAVKKNARELKLEPILQRFETGRHGWIPRVLDGLEAL